MTAAVLLAVAAGIIVRLLILAGHNPYTEGGDR